MYGKRAGSIEGTPLLEIKWPARTVLGNKLEDICEGEEENDR
jgi:hypothetical protein